MRLEQGLQPDLNHKETLAEIAAEQKAETAIDLLLVCDAHYSIQNRVAFNMGHGSHMSAWDLEIRATSFQPHAMR